MSNLKKIYKNLKRNSKELENIEGTIHNIKVLPFYSIYGTEQQREKDLQTAKDAKRDALNERHVILENLAIAVNKELNYLSQEDRKLKAV